MCVSALLTYIILFRGCELSIFMGTKKLCVQQTTYLQSFPTQWSCPMFSYCHKPFYKTPPRINTAEPHWHGVL